MAPGVGLPEVILRPGPTRATVAVLAGARSFREVARVCGWRSQTTAYRHLLAARDAGLVTWEPARAGTLRVLVRPVGIRPKPVDNRQMVLPIEVA